MPYPWSAGNVLTATDLNSALAAKTDLAMTQNAQTGTSYSYVLLDAAKLLTMNNAASNTVTVTKQATVTWVTGTQLRIMNLGAGTTTLVADTGVTINGNVALKQYQGGTLIRTASDVWLFVPTYSPSGMDIITPTSIANVGGSATLSGDTVTFSAITTSVSLNGIFTSGYENYRLLITGTGTTDDSILARLRLAGTDNSTASSYVSNILNVTSTTVGGTRIAGTSWNLEGLDTTNMFSQAFDIMRPAVAQQTGLLGMSNKSSRLAMRGGHHTQAVAYDGITLLPGTGNMTGTIRVYGYKGT